MTKKSAKCQVPKYARYHVRDVCQAGVPECLINLYWHNEKDEVLIATVAELLDPSCDGWLALAAVRARFAAVADWSLRHASKLSMPAGTCDAAVLRAMAATPLFFMRGRYSFCDWKFLAAIRAHSAVVDAEGLETALH